MLTGIGPVSIEVPRDTESSFDPRIVRKRQRRLAGVDEIDWAKAALAKAERIRRGRTRIRADASRRIIEQQRL